MATWYVDSTATGSGAGTSWTNACTTIANAITLSAAGDDFNVYNAHAETSATAITLTFPGTAASPNRVFSCDRTNTPAQASDQLAGASVSVTGSVTAITVNGFIYVYGVKFNAGSGANRGDITLGNTSSEQTYENCAFALLQTSGTAGGIAMGTASSNTSSKCHWKNCTYTAGVVGNLLKGNGGDFTWSNTAPALVGGTAPSALIGISRSGHIILDGLDLSSIGSGGKSLVATNAGPVDVQIKNCRLNASVIRASTPGTPGNFVDVINCNSTATGYRQERYTYAGTLSEETVVVRTGGANDGVIPISWKVVTTANSERQSPFETFEIIQWVNTTGVSRTATIEVITDNVTLTNADIWMEAQVLDNASFPISSLYTTAPATQLTAGTNLTSSSATWTTTGITTPITQNMSITFTNQLQGYVRIVVKVAKVSLTTLRIDPRITIV